MPAINFKKQFAEKIRTGEKIQTIRLLRKNPIKIGDTLHLYTGMRTRWCEKILEAKCESIAEIEISDMIRIGGFGLKYQEALEFAKDDGFETLKEFWDFFKQHYRLPFKGVVITWRS